MSYANCTAAYQAGVSDIPASSPDYAKKLDRDNDGVGCETKDAPSWFVKGAKAKPGETSTGTKVETGAGNGTTLPKTGPGGTELGVGGGAILAVGLIAALVARRRKLRFTA